MASLGYMNSYLRSKNNSHTEIQSPKGVVLGGRQALEQLLSKEGQPSQAVGVHTFSPSAWKVEAGESLS